MKTISFSNEEIRELIKFYEEELRKTEERLNTISEIIKKLNASLDQEASEVEVEASKEPAPVTPKKPTSEKATKKTTASEKASQKRGMKPSTKKARQEVNLKKLDWENFFYDLLKKKQDVMAISEFSNAAYEHFNLYSHKAKNVNYKIRTELNKLVDNGKLEKERIPGVKGFAYGLPELVKKKREREKKAASSAAAAEKKTDTAASTTTKSSKSTSSPKNTATAESTDKQAVKKPNAEVTSDTILQLIEKEDRPLAPTEISDLIFERGNYAKKEKRKIEKKVNQILDEIFNAGKVKKHFIEHSNVPNYGLPSMFDENDKLKEQYQKKVNF